MKSLRIRILFPFTVGLALMLSACGSKAESSRTQAEKPAEAKSTEIIATQNEALATQIVSSPQDEETSLNSWGLQPAVTDNQGAWLKLLRSTCAMLSKCSILRSYSTLIRWT